MCLFFGYCLLGFLLVDGGVFLSLLWMLIFGECEDLGVYWF